MRTKSGRAGAAGAIALIASSVGGIAPTAGTAWAQSSAQSLPQSPAQTKPEAGPAHSKARLDALFAALQAAGGDAEAQEVVRDIWETWTMSGRDDVDLLMQQAGGLMQRRHFGMASKLLDEVVALAPSFAEGWNQRATLRFLMGDHAGSEADIARVLALEPRHFGALSGRAMIHTQAERWREALEAYRAALAVNPFLADRHQMVPELERRAGENRL